MTNTFSKVIEFQSKKFEKYRVNYEDMQNLSFVKKILKKNEKLKEENQHLSNLFYEINMKNEILTNVVSELRDMMIKMSQKKKNKKRKLRQEKVEDDEVVYVKNEKTNIIYELSDDEMVESFEEISEQPIKIEEVVVSLQTKIDTLVEHIEEEEEEEVVEKAQEKVIVEKVEEVVEEEEEVVEEEVVEEEEEVVEEEEVQEEEEAEEEEEEVYEITIKGKSYYTTNEKNGTIYDIDENGDISEEVGKFENGVAKFA